MNSAMVRVMRAHKYLALLTCLLNTTALSAADPFNLKELSLHSIYVGTSSGFGSTTWYGLVPSEENQNVAITLSAPTMANEGGVVLGGFAGYEFSPYFALESSYQHYPTATLTFDANSIFTFENDGRTTLSTQTEVAAFMAKIMLHIPDTPARFFSSTGIADIHRSDEINDKWIISPSFSAGLNYTFTPHIMGEIYANYTAGYGESEINPVNDFIPFLYSVSFRIAYRI